MKKIAIGADHAGFQLKKEIIEYLHKKDIEARDFGTYSEDLLGPPFFPPCRFFN